MSRLRLAGIHAVLLFAAFLTLAPLAFMVNNAFRENREFYRSFFALPDALKDLAHVAAGGLRGEKTAVEIVDEEGRVSTVSGREAASRLFDKLMSGPRRAWSLLRRYVFNSFLVSGLSAFGVALFGSGTAYILARYRFMGRQVLLSFLVATMVFPSVLTLVPSFILVKQLHLLNTYWGMILPYVGTGQVFAIFVFRSFFLSLPEELFESARLEGAGHFRLYWHLVLPLSGPVFSVVLIMNILGTWNNFLWPYLVNTDDRHQVVASGLYTMATSSVAGNANTLFAAYLLSSIPLLVLFIYATRPFVRGITGGALKA